MPIVSTPGQIPKVSNPIASVPSSPVTTQTNYTPNQPDVPVSSSFTPPPPIPTTQPVIQKPAPVMPQTMPKSRLQTAVGASSPAKSPFLTDDSDDDLDALSPLTNAMDDEDNEESPFAPTPPITTSSAKPTGTALSRMSEDERRAIITKCFTLVLGREPVDRDFSYYRFSTLTEDGLIKSLLSLPEHKQLLEKAKEHHALKQSLADLDLQVQQLTATYNSMTQELQTMQYLLAEKNRYIQQMRGIPEGEQVILPPKPEPKPENNKNGSTSILQAVETKKLPTPVDEMRSMIKGLFGKK